MIPNYSDFLQSKQLRTYEAGIDISVDQLNSILFPFQRDTVKWACKKGRCAIFADTGLGKTFMQVEFARLMGGRSLIVAPLSVARQTVREAKKISVDVHYTRSGEDLTDGINITNYDMIEHFNADKFQVIVLDESSILKSIDGKTRKKLTQMFSRTPFRLCCTATPAPNDMAEIGNHSEFLGVMTTPEMLATFFVHDDQDWRLRGYAKKAFYKWLSSWGMSIRMPSDLGYDDDGFILPALTVTPEWVKTDYTPEGFLFHPGLKGISDRAKIRKSTIADRLTRIDDLLKTDDGQWIVWCGLNSESEAVSRSRNDCVELTGNDDPDVKIKTIEDFQDGKFRILVTKPHIAGFGMNFQNCHNMIFMGMNDSFEMYYQCIRRSYRFGQKNPVNVSIVISSAEREVYDNVLRKQAEAQEMTTELMGQVKEYEQLELTGQKSCVENEVNEKIEGKMFTAYKGDSAEVLKELQPDSIDMSVYSPPFADLYTYSQTERDLGNSKNWNEFFEHYAFIIRELLRVTKQGRVTCVHTADIPAMAGKDGYIGLKDFSGRVIAEYEKNGWILHGRVTIQKNPKVQAIRTHSKALLFVQMEKDSICSRPAIADYILIFKKPGENLIPVQPVKNGEITRDLWLSWAHPIWFDIQESNTLQRSVAREGSDDKHICPLQLDVIDRCVRLWSNPDDVVLTPFGGIGSEAYQAITRGRKAVLIELKKSYFDVAVKNCEKAESKTLSERLF